MTEPTDGLARFQSIKTVKAGQITEVAAAGCYVKESDGTGVLRIFPDGMTARYQPLVGDFWVIYDDGYQAISPRHAFVDGYVPLGIGGEANQAAVTRPKSQEKPQ